METIIPECIALLTDIYSFACPIIVLVEVSQLVARIFFRAVFHGRLYF